MAPGSFKGSGAILILLKNIKCMVGVSYHILSFTSCQMIFYIQILYRVAHMLDSFPHEMRVTICCDKMKRRYIEFLPQILDVFFPVQSKYIFRV